jgi:hypothetical protein
LTAAAVGGLGTAAIDVGGDVLYDLASKQSVTNIDWRGAAVDLAVGAALPFASGMGNGLIRQAVEGAVGTLAGFDVAAISSIVGTSATYSVTSGQACQQ